MELNTKRKRVRRKKRKRRKKRRKGKKIEKEMRKEKKERNAKNWKISPPWPKELLTATDARDHHGIETAEILVVKGKNCYLKSFLFQNYDSGEGNYLIKVHFMTAKF